MTKVLIYTLEFHTCPRLVFWFFLILFLSLVIGFAHVFILSYLFIDSLIFFGVIGDINLQITIQNKGLEWTGGRRLYLWRNFSSIAIANAERLLGVELCQVPWEIQGGIKHSTELTYLMSILPPHSQMVSSMSAGGGFSFGMIFLP